MQTRSDTQKQFRDETNLMLYYIIVKVIQSFALLFSNAQEFVFGERSARIFASNKYSGSVFSRTRLLFRHHIFYFVRKILPVLGKVFHVAWHFVYVTDFLKQFFMLQANLVRFFLARSPNLLCFVTVFYCIRSCNIQNVHAASTMVVGRLLDILAL